MIQVVSTIMTKNKSTRDFVWKLVMGGQGGVGKTTILHRFVHGEFIADTKLTIGVDFHKKVVEQQGCSIEMVLWDLGGQEHFKNLHDSYLRGASGGFVCFDLTQRPSLDRSRDWIAMFRKSDPGMPILLVGTKYDLIENDPGGYNAAVEDANAIVEQYGLLGLTITSAKTNLNVDETILYLTGAILCASTPVVQ